MKRLSGGIDIGSESHHITILDEEDIIIYFRYLVFKEHIELNLLLR